MSVGMKLGLRLAQQMKITPQMQQSIKMLQMNRVELEAEIRKELEENPVLEEHDAPLAEASTAQAEKKDPVSHGKENAAENYNAWEGGGGSGLGSGLVATEGAHKSKKSASPIDAPQYDNIASPSRSLKEHLLWQIGLSRYSTRERQLLELLVDYVDENAWLVVPLEKIATEAGIKTSAQELEKVLPLLWRLEPVGVGARSLKECLLLQAKDMEEDTKDMRLLIAEHLDLLKNQDYQGLAQKMHLSIEEVKDLCQIIRSMDPKPGRAFAKSAVQYQVPDVYIKKVGSDIVVSLNNSGLPNLKVSSYYDKVLKQTKNKDTLYIKEKMKNALWLVKSLRSRQQSIYKVAQCLARHQVEFLEKGPKHIKPLGLKEVAEEVGLHASSVSRVTSNKYVHTPYGIFSFKTFFSLGIATASGEKLSTQAVRLKIKKLIASEPARKPISDQSIADILRKQGLDLSRRTVAKYRAAMDIASSAQRKRKVV